MAVLTRALGMLEQALAASGRAAWGSMSAAAGS
jgi:hypothetical protein